MKKISPTTESTSRNAKAPLRGARSAEEREMLLQMVEHGESLAVAREKKLAQEGRAGHD